MPNLVLNEWVWADLAGDNGQPQELEAFDFLRKVYAGDDRIVIVRPSPSMSKLWSLCKETQYPRRGYAKFIMNNFFFNSSKCLLLEHQTLSVLPESLNTLVKPDDQYLVRALRSVGDSLLITTDSPLKRILNEHEIACRCRDQYLRTY